MNNEVFDALKEFFSGHSATGVSPFDNDVYRHLIHSTDMHPLGGLSLV